MHAVVGQGISRSKDPGYVKGATGATGVFFSFVAMSPVARRCARRSNSIDRRVVFYFMVFYFMWGLLKNGWRFE